MAKPAENGVYCIYLRKSRTDIEAEEHGEGDTLSRHESALTELAQKKSLHVTAIYREVVSGETISARPIMQQLLGEVEQGAWSGVLVMEVERLARGDTIDQGIVAQAFKYSNTKIITPLKTYDPTDEFDEEYFEFGLFMSRREYKTINRRLQRGRLASVQEGKYVGNIPPYGYYRVKLAHDKGFTLAPDPNESGIVQNIFDWYLHGTLDSSKSNIGISLIARRLNDMGIPTRKGGTWTAATVITILKNPVYAGLIKWNSRPSVKQSINGKIMRSRPRARLDDIILIPGLHPALIDQDMYNSVQEIMRGKSKGTIPGKLAIKNPLAGIIVCGKCGRKMVRRPYSTGQAASLICADPQCSNVSSYLSLVEARVLSSLKALLDEIKLDSQNVERNNIKEKQADNLKKIIHNLKCQKEKIEQQFNSLYDLLEQGIYDHKTFTIRSKTLHERSADIENQINESLNKLAALNADQVEKAEMIPKIQSVLEAYEKSNSIEVKNELLKSVVEKIVYIKNARNDLTGFELTVYPKIKSEVYYNL